MRKVNVTKKVRKKNSVNYANIDGGLVKGQGSSVSGFNDSTQVRPQIHTTVLSEVPPLALYPFMGFQVEFMTVTMAPYVLIFCISTGS